MSDDSRKSPIGEGLTYGLPALAIAIMLFMWWFERYYGIAASLAVAEVRLVQLRVLDFLLSPFGISYKPEINLLLSLSAEQIKDSIWAWSNVANQIPAILFLGALCWMGRKAWNKPIDLKYRGALNLETFIEAQSKAWPSILPALAENPANPKTWAKGSAKTRWDEAYDDDKWLRVNGVPMIPAGQAKEGEPVSEKRAPDPAAVRETFVKQLATDFSGISFDDKGNPLIEPYQQALIAAFIYNGGLCRKDKGVADKSTDLLALLNVAWFTEIMESKKADGRLRPKTILGKLLRPFWLIAGRLGLASFGVEPRPFSEVVKSNDKIMTLVSEALEPAPRTVDWWKSNGTGKYRTWREEYRALYQNFAREDRVDPEVRARLQFLSAVAYAHSLPKRHAFLETAMISLLVWCRQEGGVLASADFLWLKPVNRTLWYALNNAGRGGNAYHIEAAGLMSHWHMECSRGKAIYVPAVEPAVTAIVERYM